MKATLYRFADTPFGTFGYLDLEDGASGVVERFAIAEDDWLDNALAISCIPAGSYVCRRRQSPKFGDTFRIENVPGRSQILFHAGNTEEDTMGCLLVGSAFGALTVEDEDDPQHRPTLKWAVTGSRPAFARFRARLAGIQEFPLQILWAPPGLWRDPPPFR